VNEITSPIVTPLRDRYLGDLKTVGGVVLGAVAVVLLIACVNIAALTMVRGAVRAREIAIRTAIGASQARVIAQLLIETLVLAGSGGRHGLVSIGAAAGLTGALLVARLLRTLLFGVSAYDPIVYAAMVAGALGVGLIATLAPARGAARIAPARALHLE
jgi:putative ABC transport system permease protein